MVKNSFESNLVSIITPNFNGVKFISRLVESIKVQISPFEHIIIDDCSTDESWEVLLSLSEIYPWLRIYKLNLNQGPLIARNVGIKHAKGRYLAFVDVDDFWLPDKLKVQINFMLKNDCAISFTDYRFISHDGKLIGRKLSGFNQIGWHIHHMTRFLGCLTIVIDRRKLPDFFFPDIRPAIRAEDFLAWSFCISKGFKALRCPYDLARYTDTKESRSSITFKSILSVWILYRRVEKIDFFTSLFYFISYILFAIWKRFWFRPIWQRKDIFMCF